MAPGSIFSFSIGQRQLMSAAGGRQVCCQLNWLCKLLALKAETGGAFPEMKQQVEQPLGPIFLNTMLF